MMTMENLVAELDDLPSLPAVVMELLDTMSHEDVDITVLARKVSADGALTAKTLRLANSSAFGLQIKATTIQQAMTFLGFQTTRNLVMTAALTGCFPTGRCPAFNDTAFWRHAIATAACARSLARQVHFNHDVAYTAGLLHSIGQLVLVTRYPEPYQQVLLERQRLDADLLAVEQAMLGVDHIMAGVALAEHWQFSDTMRHAIAHQRTPDLPGAGFLATIVHVARAVAHALDLPGDPDAAVPPLSNLAWGALNIPAQTWLQILRETELQCEEMSVILKM